MKYYIVIMHVGEGAEPCNVLSYDDEEARDKHLQRFKSKATNPDWWFYEYFPINEIV